MPNDYPKGVESSDSKSIGSLTHRDRDIVWSA